MPTQARVSAATREQRGQHRREASQRPRLVDVGVERTHVVDRQRGIERPDGVVHRPDRASPDRPIALIEVDRGIARHLPLGEVHLVAHLFGRAAVAHVPDHADHGRPGGRACRPPRGRRRAAGRAPMRPATCAAPAARPRSSPGPPWWSSLSVKVRPSTKRHAEQLHQPGGDGAIVGLRRRRGIGALGGEVRAAPVGHVIVRGVADRRRPRWRRASPPAPPAAGARTR